jgi:hypothetical protein
MRLWKGPSPAGRGCIGEKVSCHVLTVVTITGSSTSANWSAVMSTMRPSGSIQARVAPPRNPLRELRDEGMLEFRRGRGITVAGTPERGVVMTRVKELVALARQQGYQPDEVIAMIQAVS